MSFANKFGVLKAAVDEGLAEGAPATKAAAPKEKTAGHGREKKITVKAKPQQNLNQGAMEEGGYTMGGNQRQGEDGDNRRGGRGGRGGQKSNLPRGVGFQGGDRHQETGEGRPRTARGGRGGRGEGRPRREEGEGQVEGEQRQGGRGRGDRGGRGRGRPRNDRTTQLGADATEGPERAGRGDDYKQHGYQGKAREQYHPMDRHSGTGVGKKDQRKGGNRPGQAGVDKNDNFDAATPVAEEKKGEENEEKKEGEEEKPAEEEKKVEKEESEDEEALPGIDFADWEAKKRAEKASMQHNKTRERVENTTEKVLKNDNVKQPVANTIDTNVTGRDMHAVRAGTGADLLGFGFAGGDEEEFQGRDQRGGDRRGGRGGRGRDQGGRGAGRGAGRQEGQRQPQAQRTGGKRGGRIVANEEEFPCL